MNGRKVEWSLRGDPDLFIDIWSAAALVEAVLAALLGDPREAERAWHALGATAGVAP